MSGFISNRATPGIDRESNGDGSQGVTGDTYNEIAGCLEMSRSSRPRRRSLFVYFIVTRLGAGSGCRAAHDEYARSEFQAEC